MCLLPGKKLKLDDSTSTSDVNDCNVIVNIELLKNVFEKLCRCPDCGNPIKINHNMKKKKGMAHMLDIVCHLCEWKDNLCTSKTISKTESKRGRKAYVVNTRTCIAFREIGRGYDCIRTVCMSMNFPPPPPPPPPPPCNQMFISQ